MRSFGGFGSNSINHETTGFRAKSMRSGTTPAHDWRNYPSHIESFTERLRGVTIERRDAVEVMKLNDSPGTLHYVDPPYVHATRSIRSTDDYYEFEYDDQGHRDLITSLCELEGMVILSGYNCALYDEILTGWARRDRSALSAAGQGPGLSVFGSTMQRTPALHNRRYLTFPRKSL